MNKNEIAEPAIQDTHTEDVDTYTAARPHRRRSRLCTGLSTLAWALHLFVSYAFVEWHCQNLVFNHNTAKWILNGLTVGFVVIAVACTFISRNNIREQASHAQRTKQRLFAAKLSTLLCGLLAVIIAVQGLPNLMVSLC